MEVLFLPLEGTESGLEIESEDGDRGKSVLYFSDSDGRIRLASVFLPGEWVGAEVRFEEGKASLVVEGPARLELPLAFGSEGVNIER